MARRATVEESRRGGDRFWPPAGRLVALAALLCGCSDPDGAVLLQWRLIDAATGAQPQSCDLKTVAESTRWCCGRVVAGDGLRTLVIDQVVLLAVQVASIGQPGSTSQPWSSTPFDCLPNEHATDFVLPASTDTEYALSIEARRCGTRIGSTPPAVVRTLRGGETTNLNSIEIRLDSASPQVGVDLAASAAPECAADLSLPASADQAAPADLLDESVVPQG